MEPILLYSIFLAFLVSVARADTPANCTFEDTRGVWLFYETEKNNSGPVPNCSNTGKFVNKIKVDLQYPNVALDQYGNIGEWTIVYNQGFEVTVAGRKYFTFFKYEENETTVVSCCYAGVPGWSHDVLGHNWACFLGKKIGNATTKVHQKPKLLQQTGLYRVNRTLIQHINKVQKSWTAKYYKKFDGISHESYLRLIGGKHSFIYGRPKTAPVSLETARLVRYLPEQFDWRNINGVNYVSPVRDQGDCGSCYAFASLGMIEARLNIMTNNTLGQVFSPQDVVSCSYYSQGCDGGFPYLISGKYAYDFGVVQESCNKYQGVDISCTTKSTCQRYYSSKYYYVGGFYGGCNEEKMRLGLITNGPMAVSFMVYPDFLHYSGGIYRHVFTQNEHLSKFDPFELTNHAVLVVGYGVNKTTSEKYWIVKNSWGPEWGEKGYFRILRGVDECGIESLGSETFPILP